MKSMGQTQEEYYRGVRMVPYDLIKELAIALALTSADGGLPEGVLDGVAVLGELGLDGAVRPVAGTLALVDAVVRGGAECVIVPAANAAMTIAERPGARVRLPAASRPAMPKSDWLNGCASREITAAKSGAAASAARRISTRLP